MWLCAPSGSVATAEDPAAIATIQSATTFSDQPIKYLFKTEGAGGQVGRRVLIEKSGDETIILANVELVS